jgi:hypothetical protein
VTKALATIALGAVGMALVIQPALSRTATATAASARQDDRQLATTPTTLKPADKAESEAAYRAARSGKLGTRYKFEGMQLVVTAIEASTKDGAVPRFAITVRTENRTGRTLRNPQGVIACKNTADEGTWYAESTWMPNARLRAKTFSEGTLVLGYPSVRYGEPVASCRRPVVRFSPTGVYSGEFPPAIQLAIPARVGSAANGAPVRSG